MLLKAEVVPDVGGGGRVLEEEVVVCWKRRRSGVERRSVTHERLDVVFEIVVIIPRRARAIF